MSVLKNEELEEKRINLTAGDLQNVVQIIDIASSKGVFKGADLETVGILYNKISTFVQQINVPKKDEKETEEPK